MLRCLTGLSLFLTLSVACATGVHPLRIWSGGGSDSKLGTAENWESGTVPSTGETLLFPKGSSFENNLENLSPSGITISNNLSSTTFRGHPFLVGESGFNLLLMENTYSVSFEKMFTGSGTLTFQNRSINTGSGISIFQTRENGFSFSGKWILDRSSIGTLSEITLIGSENPEEVVPDAVTLKNGACIKNYKSTLVIEPRTGVVLGEGGGGFCCGWKSSGNHSLQVNCPISGSGPLLIASCPLPIFLNSTNNSYTGKTVIGSAENVLSFNVNETEETRLVIGGDYAIPRGNDVTVDGSSRAVLELDGHSLELGRLELIAGGILRNSSGTPATVRADTVVFGGRIEGAITLEYRYKELAGSPDHQVWESGQWLTVVSGENLNLGDMGLGGVALKLDGGTLTLPLHSGFAESAYSGNRCLNDEKRITAYRSGADMGSASSSSLWKDESGYYYQTLWYIPVSGPYSFCKHFDDRAALQIDRDLVLADNIYNATAQRTGYFLNQGWHEVRIWFANLDGGVGPGEWGEGIKWIAGEEEIFFDSGKGFSTENGAFVFSPSLIRPLYVGPSGGNVQRSAEPDFTGEIPDLLLYGGVIESPDNTNSAPLHVDGGVVVGLRDASIPVFDARLALPPGKSLTFRDRVWIRRIPDCAYSILPGTEVFLDPEIYGAMRDRVISDGGKICWASFNLPEVSPENPIRIVSGEEQALFQSTTFRGDTPLLDNNKWILPNAFHIENGGRLLLNLQGNIRFSGALSGEGDVDLVAYGDPSPTITLNFTGNNASFTGTFNSSLPNVHFRGENPENLGAGVVQVSGEATTIVLGRSGVPLSVYPVSFEVNGNAAFEILGGEVSVTNMKISREVSGLQIVKGVVAVKASAFDCPEGLAVNGPGILKIEIDRPGFEKFTSFTGTGNLMFAGDRGIDLRPFVDSFEGRILLDDAVHFVMDSSSLPEPLLWLDASNTGSCRRDEQGDVIQWSDCRDGRTDGDGPSHPYAYLNRTVRNDANSGYKTANSPQLYDDQFLGNSPVLDFGEGNSGCWLSLSTPIAMRTAIFVIGSQNGGGTCFFSYSKDSKGIIRDGDLDHVTPSNPMFTAGGWGNALFRNARVRKNGVQVSSSSGLSGGYEIITVRISQNQYLDTLAKDSRTFSGGEGDFSRRSGGMRYAELLFYDRDLEDSEVLAVEKYLEGKWLGAFPPAGKTMAEPARIEIAERVTIDVPDPSSVERLLNPRGNGTLVKTGAGTLHLPGNREYGGTIEWQAGTMSLGESLPEPAFWVDMTKGDSFGTDDNGRFYLRDRRWDGVTDYLVATQRWSSAPWVANGMLSTRSVLDFGTLSKTHDRGLQWSRMLDVRALFMVIGSQNSGGTILGGDDSNSPYGRGNFSSAADPIVDRSYSDGRTRNGLFRLDGVSVDGSTTGFSGGYQVLVSYPTASVRAGQFAHDRELSSTKNRDGGQRFGEVLVFTNELSSSQILNIEAYLTSKWMKRKEITLGTADVAEHMVLPAGGTMRLENRSDNYLAALSGGADLEVCGKGTLRLGDISAYTGTLSLCSGKLALESPAHRILKRSRFWVDASKPGSMTLSESSGEVMQWRDCRENGVWANRSDSDSSTVNGTVYPNHGPLLLENELNGLPVLDFGEWEGNRFLFWNNGGISIRTVFWVIGSQNGGGLLLGSSESARDFFRAGGGENHDNWDVIEAQNPIWAGKYYEVCKAVINGKTWLNGLSVDGTETGLSGGYDIVSLRTTGPTKASAFAIDCSRRFRNATGGQRLAEVIVFEEVLTDADTRIVEAYLSEKWGIAVSNHVDSCSESDMEISLTPKTELSLSDYGTYRVGSVGGVGRVTGCADLSLRKFEQVSADSEADRLDFEGSVSMTDGGRWKITLDGSEVAPIHIAGSFDLMGGGSMTLTGAKAIGNDPMLLLSAQEIKTAPLQEWSVKSDDPGRYFSLANRENSLFLIPRGKGLILLLK